MILRLGSLTIVLIGGLWLAAATMASQGLTGIDRARLLEGAIDVHVHSYPDDRPRSIDAIEVAKLAHARKLRAIVLKNHYDSTAGLAFLVRKVVPDIEVFGGVALNLTVAMGPEANSSRAETWVSMVTSKVSPARGPLPMVR